MYRVTFRYRLIPFSFLAFADFTRYLGSVFSEFFFCNEIRRSSTSRGSVVLVNVKFMPFASSLWVSFEVLICVALDFQIKTGNVGIGIMDLQSRINYQGRYLFLWVCGIHNLYPRLIFRDYETYLIKYERRSYRSFGQNLARVVVGSELTNHFYN